MFDCYDTLITPEEVADMLGKIKAMRIGRSWKIPKRAVQEYIIQESHLKSVGW